MQKIPTLFVRDEIRQGHPVTEQWKSECLWVRDGEGVPTEKFDGTNVKVDGQRLYKRQKPKDRDYDAASYVACRRDNPADQWAFEAFDLGDPDHDLVDPSNWPDGIYELIGPKVQGNPYRLTRHRLVQVVPTNLNLILPDVALPEHRTFHALQTWLMINQKEGIVFHHPDGRMAKIKRRDFGLTWPQQNGSHE